MICDTVRDRTVLEFVPHVPNKYLYFYTQWKRRSVRPENRPEATSRYLFLIFTSIARLKNGNFPRTNGTKRSRLLVNRFELTEMSYASRFKLVKLEITGCLEGRVFTRSPCHDSIF